MTAINGPWSKITRNLPSNVRHTDSVLSGNEANLCYVGSCFHLRSLILFYLGYSFWPHKNDKNVLIF